MTTLNDCFMDAGNITWLLVASAMVMFMTPGLAFFYGGLVRSKNGLSIMMHCFTILAVVSITWILWGYSLAFGSSYFGLIGSLEHLGLNGVVGAEAQTFMVFQMMFAIITPALIVGAIADRFKFTSLIAFVIENIFFDFLISSFKIYSNLSILKLL